MKKAFNFELVFNGVYVYTNIISSSLGAKKKNVKIAQMGALNSSQKLLY
jgi:hypothetical protein